MSTTLSSTPKEEDYWPSAAEYAAYLERRKTGQATAEDNAKGDHMIADFMALRNQRLKEGREAAGYKMTCDGCGASDYDEAELESCRHCLFTACESCQVHTSRGVYMNGSWWRASLLIVLYQNYHRSRTSGRQYTGPRHPEQMPWNKEQYEWEATPRDCENCGKKGVIHLDPNSAKNGANNGECV
ncbi:hypothetical protein P7C70_g2919, partial [Phenoliferia sp. Uapishka_3]